MGTQISLNTAGTQCIGAYLARPAGKSRGGIVVVQEIFGVNAHVRSVTDGFAAHGYTAIAPAFFDHVESNVELGYDASGFARGKALVGEISFDRAIQDVASAAEAIKSAGNIGVVGYCWGRHCRPARSDAIGNARGKLLRGAQRAVSRGETQGTRAISFPAERDASITAEAVQRHRDALPDMEIYTYPADHAFNRDVDPSHYDAASAKLARERTLAFFARHLGGG